MATRQDPHAHSVGVVGVWVSGARVYENGLFTGVYPGQWIEEQGNAMCLQYTFTKLGKLLYNKGI